MPTDSSSSHEQQRRRKPTSAADASSSAKHRSGSERSTTSSTSSSSSGSHKTSSSSAASSSSSSSSSKRARARFSVPEDAQGLSQFASLTGFLRKQADNEQGAWNKYYFALRPATLLYYYNTPTDDRPRGIIDLEFLKDIRYNVDCLQRSVGGSEHCFRVTGQMPRREDAAGSSSESGGNSKQKLRPLYLDPESPLEAREWMQALEKHRFNVEHAEGFHRMSVRVRETEQTLKQLEDEAKRVASTAERIRRTGRSLLNKLRGIESSDDDPAAESRESSDADSNQDDIFSTLQELESLVEDFNAEAAQQARVIATLRERETQQEKKLRELTKLAAAIPAKPVAPPAATDDSSIISADEFSRMERVGAAKGRSTSDVRDLFKFKKTTTFLSKKPADPSAAVPASSPKVALEACAEGGEDEEEDSEEAPVKKIGFVGALKKRVTKSSAPSAPQASTPTSRESDDTVSITTEDRESEEAAADDKLPRGWTKRESRTNPGEHYYVHSSGFTCWEIPTDFVTDDEQEDAPPQEPPAEKKKKPTKALTAEKEKSSSEPQAEEKPLGSFAAVAVAAMDEAAAPEENNADEGNKAPAKKASKGWGFLKKFPKPALSKAATAAPASPQSPLVAVEHADGRHEF